MPPTPLDPNQPVSITLAAHKWNTLLGILQERVGPINTLIAEIAQQGNAAGEPVVGGEEFQSAAGNGPRRSRGERLPPNSS